MEINTVRQVETPLQSQPSSKPGDPWLRLGAFCIDSLYVGLLNLLVLFIFFKLGITSQVIGYMGILVFLCYAIIVTFKTGTTYAKDACGMRVVSYGTGSTLTFRQVFIREFVKIGIVMVPFLGSFFALANGIKILRSADRRGYHDRWANTVVVTTKTAWVPRKLAVFVLIPIVLSFVFIAYIANQPGMLDYMER